MKNIKTIEARQACADTFRKLRHESLIIKNELSQAIKERLSWQNIQSSLPNLTVQLTESLATAKRRNDESNALRYYCKLHDYINYCKGERVNFTLQAGPFDVKSIELDKNKKRLYLLSLNCNKNPILASCVTLDSRFGDWFEKYFPQYLKEIVYDKGHTWFFIGPEETESELHSDHDFVHTTLQQCDGTKEVYLVDPIETSQFIKEHGMTITFKVRDGRAILYQDKIEILDKAVDDKVSYGVLEAGDTLYIPSSWGHMVRAKSKSITVSRDFIDERNADDYFTSRCRMSQ